MKKRPSHVALSPASPSPESFNFSGMLYLYCAHARDAAAHGRFRAAHGLFQSAVLFYDHVEQRTKNHNAIEDSESETLVAARAELDDCAVSVYPDVDALHSSARSFS